MYGQEIPAIMDQLSCNWPSVGEALLPCASPASLLDPSASLIKVADLLKPKPSINRRSGFSLSRFEWVGGPPFLQLQFDIVLIQNRKANVTKIE